MSQISEIERLLQESGGVPKKRHIVHRRPVSQERPTTTPNPATFRKGKTLDADTKKVMRSHKRHQSADFEIIPKRDTVRNNVRRTTMGNKPMVRRNVRTQSGDTNIRTIKNMEMNAFGQRINMPSRERFKDFHLQTKQFSPSKSSREPDFQHAVMTSKRMYETRLSNTVALLSPKTMPTPKAQSLSMPSTPKAHTDFKLQKVTRFEGASANASPDREKKKTRTEQTEDELFRRYNRIVYQVFWKQPEVTQRQKYQKLRDQDNYNNWHAKKKVMDAMKPKEYYDDIHL